MVPTVHCCEKLIPDSQASLVGRGIKIANQSSLWQEILCLHPTNCTSVLASLRGTTPPLSIYCKAEIVLGRVSGLAWAIGVHEPFGCDGRTCVIPVISLRISKQGSHSTLLACPSSGENSSGGLAGCLSRVRSTPLSSLGAGDKESSQEGNHTRAPARACFCRYKAQFRG